MKFTYSKIEPKIIHAEDEGTLHVVTLEGSDERAPFQILASKLGVRMHGVTQHFQPEPGEVNLPVDQFREFMARLSYAFTLAFKEQEKERKNEAGRKALLSSI
jgi:hypothetical protein